MNVEQALKQLEPASMTRLLIKLYGIYGNIDEIIDRHIVTESSVAGGGHSIADSLIR